jgi:hypothetical protein
MRRLPEINTAKHGELFTKPSKGNQRKTKTTLTHLIYWLIYWFTDSDVDQRNVHFRKMVPAPAPDAPPIDSLFIFPLASLPDFSPATTHTDEMGSGPLLSNREIEEPVAPGGTR